MDNLDNEIQIKESKAKIVIVITTLLAITCVIVFSIITAKKVFKDFFSSRYYVLNVTNDNRKEVILLLEEEKIDYCNSINKIEYLKDHNHHITIYCGNGKIQNFDVTNKITDYIYYNGHKEKR